jgi:uncharacterized protein YbjT (DUF2867 family)
MILVADGTGTLGAKAVGLLAGRGARVRVLTRDHSRARNLGVRVETVEGEQAQRLRKRAEGRPTHPLLSRFHSGRAGLS